MIKKITPLLLILLITSCTKTEPPTKEQCNEISMKAFRGLPKESKIFKDHCKDYQLEYTKEKCHKALQALTMGSKAESLKKTYGEKIMGCFNKGDLKRFL
tara:strand:- start:95503 stop:95802 length:300 start_codon:yes stop_codon:yes gene_type:complete